VNYEAGISYAHKTLETRLVYFHRRIQNGIDYNYITFSYFNYIHQTVNGFEWENSLHTTDGWNISANYTFLAGQEFTQNRVTNKDTVTYHYLLRRPKHSVNLQLGRTLAKGLYASVSAKYVSSRYDVGGYRKADVLLKSYCILGAYTEYTLNDHVKFFADAQNLTNTKFFDVWGFNSIPLLYNFGVTVKW
jgi:vitamin B12 transporter